MKSLIFPLVIAFITLLAIAGAVVYLSGMGAQDGLTSVTLTKDINTIRMREHLNTLAEDDAANRDAEAIAGNICKGEPVTLVDPANGKVAEHYTARVTGVGGKSFYSASALVTHWLADPQKKRALLRQATTLGTYAQFCGAASEGPTIVVLIR